MVTAAPPSDAAERLRLARETLAAARSLAAHGFHRDAVNRAYYAAFHAASALLATVGLHAQSHDGVRSLLSERFVRPGRLAPEHARALRHLGSDRNDADSVAATRFDATDAESALEAASALLETVTAALTGPPGVTAKD